MKKMYYENWSREYVAVRAYASLQLTTVYTSPTVLQYYSTTSLIEYKVGVRQFVVRISSYLYYNVPGSCTRYWSTRVVALLLAY